MEHYQPRVRCRPVLIGALGCAALTGLSAGCADLFGESFVWDEIDPQIVNRTEGAIEIEYVTHTARERERLRASLPPGGVFRRATLSMDASRPEPRPTAHIWSGTNPGGPELEVEFAPRHDKYEIRRIDGSLEAVIAETRGEEK